MGVFRLQSAELKPSEEAGRVGWVGMGPASCPPLISPLMICPHHPAGALALPSPGLFAVQLLGVGRKERKHGCCRPAEPAMGVQPSPVPSCPAEEDLTWRMGDV